MKVLTFIFIDLFLFYKFSDILCREMLSVGNSVHIGDELFNLFWRSQLDETGHWPIWSNRKGRCQYPGFKGFPKVQCQK